MEVLTEQKQVAGSSTHSFLSPGCFAYEEQKHKLLHALCSSLHWLTDTISIQYSVPFLHICPIYLRGELAITLNWWLVNSFDILKFFSRNIKNILLFPMVWTLKKLYSQILINLIKIFEKYSVLLHFYYIFIELEHKIKEDVH